jgi:tRNA(Ile)-lysidine synthase
LPLLETFNPAIGETLVRMAAQSNEDNAYWQAETKALVDKLAEGITLNFHPLLTLPPALRRRVLRQWLARAQGGLQRISTVHLLALDNLMMKGEGETYVELPEKRRVFRRGKTLKLQPTHKGSRT